MPELEADSQMTMTHPDWHHKGIPMLHLIQKSLQFMQAENQPMTVNVFDVSGPENSQMQF